MIEHNLVKDGRGWRRFAETPDSMTTRQGGSVSQALLLKKPLKSPWSATRARVSVENLDQQTPGIDFTSLRILSLSQ
jgi:hypothetical protein